MTRLENNCTYLATQFDQTEQISMGTHVGTCCVTGVPGRIRREHPRLLNRLEKHKERKWQPLRLDISDFGYSYQIESGLRAVISRGMKGTLFENGTRIAKIEGPSTAWIKLGPIYTKWQKLENRPRVVNWY